MIWRQYFWSFRLAGLSDAVMLLRNVFAGTICFIVLCNVVNEHVFDRALFQLNPPRSVYVIEFFFTLFGFMFVRFFPKYAYLYFNLHAKRGGISTLIYGAGGNADLLLRDLIRTRYQHDYDIVGLLDDNPSLWRTKLQGVPVLGSIESLPDILEKTGAGRLLIAIPNVTGTKMRQIIELCENYPIRLQVVPNFKDYLQHNKPRARDVKPEDLLDREPIEFDSDKMQKFLKGKKILITGGAGSIGSEIARQCASFGVEKIIIYDLNENDGYFLLSELRMKKELNVYLEIGSVRDVSRLKQVFGLHKPDVVFHAAAHKHVPLMEFCPAEAVKNNVLGTWNVSQMAILHDAARFVLISTDKAVRPSNVMGATKRLAENIICYSNQANKTRFMAVRFGNVLGSNGSLVRILEKQIANGGPVTVTHKAITRYFMTIPEAVGLVLVAASQEDGQLCVLDMGAPVSIDKLARQMILLAGLTPERDIEIQYIGLRSGEKMYEELFLEHESRVPSQHSRIQVVETKQELININEMIADAQKAADTNDSELAVSFLKKYVPEYASEVSRQT